MQHHNSQNYAYNRFTAVSKELTTGSNQLRLRVSALVCMAVCASVGKRIAKMEVVTPYAGFSTSGTYAHMAMYGNQSAFLVAVQEESVRREENQCNTGMCESTLESNTPTRFKKE